MEQKTYFVRGMLRGCRQPEEHFTSEAHARKRAAHLLTIYDSVVVDRHERRPWYRIRRQPSGPELAPDGLSMTRPGVGWWAALSQRLHNRGHGVG